MAESPPENGDTEGSRMKLEPDSIHETDGGIYLDCPQCGSNVSVVQVVNEGRCTGQLDDELAETEDDTELQEGCNAKLSLELVWEA